MIKTHDLYHVIHRMIVALIQLDPDKAIVMLLEKNKIPPDVVVQQLEQRQEYLYLVRYASLLYLSLKITEIFNSVVSRRPGQS